MKRAAAFLVGFACLATSLHGGADAGKDDLRKLQGKWKFVERVLDGKKGDLKGTWTIAGNKVSYGANSDLWAVIKLNPTTRPKALDFDHISTDPAKVVKGIKAIYDVEGDTFKICVATKGKERPKAFESKEGSGHVLTVLKRVK
jgi:uncharacterized protein (TIGR03067 family)